MKPTSRIIKLATVLGGILAYAALTTPCRALSSITLAWNPSPDPIVTGYYLYYGSKSGTYTNRLSAGHSTSNTVPNLVNGVTYYFVVTAHTDAGLESDPSNEVSYTVPFPRPQITSCRKLANGNFNVGGTSDAGKTYVLLATSRLVPPIVWTPIATNAADINGLFNCLDLRATNYAARFYRIQIGTASVPQPIITGCRKLGSGNFTISGVSAVNQTCILQAASRLAAPIVWTSIATNVADLNGLFSCSDLRATNYVNRFYRVQAR